MSIHLRNAFRGLSSVTANRYAMEAAIWEQDARAAIENPNFKKKQGVLQRRLAKHLGSTSFIKTSGSTYLTRLNETSKSGSSFVMPTITSGDLDRLRRARFRSESNVHAYGFLSHDIIRNVAVICLSPAYKLHPTDRRAIVAHQLTHSLDALNGLTNRRPQGVLLAQTNGTQARLDRASWELRAYQASAAVLNNETHGIFDDYAEEMYDQAKTKLKSGGLEIIRPDIEEYPVLDGLVSVESSASSIVLEQLFAEDAIPAARFLGALASWGVYKDIQN